MRSPFPGMDPYIEVSHLFEDFHSHLIEEMHRALSKSLPDRYVVRTGERSYVALAQADDGEEDRRSFLPDVSVASRGGAGKRTRKSKQAVGALATKGGSGPVMMRALLKEEFREAFLEIRQVDPGHKLITGIEVLSPSNKRPGTKGWRLYYRKRVAYLSGQANLVEIDLLRRGRRMPMVSAWPDSPYYFLVCRKKQAPRPQTKGCGDKADPGTFQGKPRVSRQARPFRDGAQEMSQGKQGKDRSRGDQVSLHRITPRWNSLISLLRGLVALFFKPQQEVARLHLRPGLDQHLGQRARALGVKRGLHLHGLQRK